MGTDHRIKGHRATVRCCYGVCFGFGFVLTTVLLTAMFWLIWFYFGFSAFQVSNSQRRSVVDYSYTPSSTSSPFRNTHPEIPESSMNQISRFPTATSSFPKNDPTSSIEKRKELQYDRAINLSKGDFAVRQKVNKTLNQDSSQKNGSISEYQRDSTNNLKNNSSHDDNPIQRSRISSGLTQEYSRDKKIENDLKNGSSSDTLKNGSFVHQGRIAPEGQGRVPPPDEKTIFPKDGSDEVDDFIAKSILNNKRPETDASNPDPEFIRDMSFIRNIDESRRGYDATSDIPRYDDRTDGAKLLKGDSRSFLDSKSLEQGKSIDGDRQRGPSRDEKDSTVRRRGDIDTYDSGRDRFQDKIPYDDKYEGDRKRYNEDSYIRNPSRDDRYRERVPEEDRYLRGDHRREEKIYNAPRRGQTYPDRATYDYEYPERKRGDIGEYDDRGVRESSSRDRSTDDKRYSDRYPMNDRSIGNDESKLIRDDVVRDRIPPDDKYYDKYPEEKMGDDKYEKIYPKGSRFDGRLPDDRYRDEDGRRFYDDRSPEVRYRDEERRRIYHDRLPDDRYREGERKRIYDDRYSNRDHEIRNKGDGYRYTDSVREDRIPPDRVRINDDERYRLRDRDNNRDDERYRLRDRDSRRDGENFRIRDRDGIGGSGRVIPESRDIIPPKYDTEEDSYHLRNDDDRHRNAPRGNNRDYLMSSRSDYNSDNEKSTLPRPNYSSTNDQRPINSKTLDRDYSRSYGEVESIGLKRDIKESRRDPISEDRYRSEYRDEIPAERAPFNRNRDGILPTRVLEDPYQSRYSEDRYISGNRRDQDRRLYEDNRGRDSSVNRQNQYERDHSRISPYPNLESSRNYRNKTENYPRPSYDRDNKTITGKEVILDRRSYSSEEDDYEQSYTKSRSGASSMDRYDNPNGDRNRDYQYDGYSSKRDRNYQQNRRSDYDITPTRYGDGYERADDGLVRNDKHRINQPNRNIDNKDRDIYRDRDLRRAENDKYDGRRDRYDDLYDRRRESKRPESFIPPIESVKNIGRETRLPPDIYENKAVRPSDKSSPTLPMNTGPASTATSREISLASSSSQNTSKIPRGLDTMDKAASDNYNNRHLNSKDEQRGTVDSETYDYQPDQPRSAKDVIEAALRYSGDPEQNSKKVHYPVFDPRVSNLTSPDIIRPSERRGITITAKKRK